MRTIRAVAVVGILTISLAATAAAQSTYDPHQTFDPNFLSGPGTVYRSGSGAPGPRYWQNESDYDIHVTLDAAQKRIAGTDEITYTNHSPDALHYLWIQLDQNLYKKDSRGTITAAIRNPRYITPGFDGGYDIRSVQIRNGTRWDRADYLITDTRMQIHLAHPLAAGGGKTQIRIVYSYPIPPYRQRTGWYDTKNGPIFDIAQWYPRMAVYDDVVGWNTLPYLGRGQFYLDYGTIDYAITVPWNFMVVGSGQLENPADVLTRGERERLAAARKSDTTVAIRGASAVTDPASRPTRRGTLTWHFRMHDTRDAAWAASPAFIVDAARIDLPDHRTALAESAYPVEVSGTNAWGSATQFVKHTIESDSKMWVPYPWPVAIDVAAAAGGMEYPGIVFCDWKSAGRSLWGVTTHEIGHSWFPMLVGSDERQYGFMDEGFNSFIDIYSTRAFENGRYRPYSAAETSMPRLAEYMLRTGQPDPIITYADNVKRSYVGFNNYVKPAAALYLLREDVLGHRRFDEAFRAYIRRWAYKHPTPRDFFRTMNDVAGEDLDWFWKEWFYETWTLDQSVDSVAYVNGDPARGSIITIGNEHRMVMPTSVHVVEQNGDSGTVKLPVEIWEQGASFSFRYDSHSPLDSVVVDPDHRLPDVDRTNNVWTRSARGRR